MAVALKILECPTRPWKNLKLFKNDMESLGLSQKDVQFRNKWRGANS